MVAATVGVDPSAPTAVRVSELRKHYGGVVALDGVSLDFVAGEVHALVGENGAGKSTLMKILAGAVRPDGGTIELAGRPADLTTPADARRHGIGIVYQELSLFPHQSILSNLFSGAEPTQRGVVDRAAMQAAAGPVLARLGIEADPWTPVGRLRVGERQLVEIARVLLELPRVIILDEPNSALNAKETDRLFGVVETLRRDGICVILVSHRLQEVFRISDRISVLRNGRLIRSDARASLTMQTVVQSMIGRAQQSFPARSGPPPTGPTAVSVRDLSVTGALMDISFEAATGEIIGLAGLEGSGTTVLLHVLFGLRRATAGEVRLSDGGGAPSSPTDAARRGICLVPADRRREGLMLMRPIATNTAHVRVGSLPSPWRVRRATLQAIAERQISSLSIKTRSPWTPAYQLSGGNQQKVVVGKWLEAEPSLILLEDPTRGIDIGAKFEMYSLIRRLADAGHVVILASTELSELVGLADRVLVLFRGRMVGLVDRQGLDEDLLLHAINTGIIPSSATTMQ